MYNQQISHLICLPSYVVYIYKTRIIVFLHVDNVGTGFEPMTCNFLGKQSTTELQPHASLHVLF